jgi:hypothetical protein
VTKRERSKEREAKKAEAAKLREEERVKYQKKSAEFVRQKLNLDTSSPEVKEAVIGMTEDHLDKFGIWEDWKGKVPRLIETPATPADKLMPRGDLKVHVEGDDFKGRISEVEYYHYQEDRKLEIALRERLRQAQIDAEATKKIAGGRTAMALAPPSSTICESSSSTEESSSSTVVKAREESQTRRTSSKMEMAIAPPSPTVLESSSPAEASSSTAVVKSREESQIIGSSHSSASSEAEILVAEPDFDDMHEDVPFQSSVMPIIPPIHAPHTDMPVIVGAPVFPAVPGVPATSYVDNVVAPGIGYGAAVVPVVAQPKPIAIPVRSNALDFQADVQVPVYTQPVTSDVQVPIYTQPISSEVQVPIYTQPIADDVQIPVYRLPVPSDVQVPTYVQPISSGVEVPTSVQEMQSVQAPLAAQVERISAEKQGNINPIQIQICHTNSSLAAYASEYSSSVSKEISQATYAIESSAQLKEASQAVVIDASSSQSKEIPAVVAVTQPTTAPVQTQPQAAASSGYGWSWRKALADGIQTVSAVAGQAAGTVQQTAGGAIIGAVNGASSLLQQDTYYGPELPPNMVVDVGSGVASAVGAGVVSDVVSGAISTVTSGSVSAVTSGTTSSQQQQQQQSEVYFGPELPADYSWEKAKVFTENASYIDRIHAEQPRIKDEILMKEQQKEENAVFFGPALPTGFLFRTVEYQGSKSAEKITSAERVTFDQRQTDIYYGCELPANFSFKEVSYQSSRSSKSATELAQAERITAEQKQIQKQQEKEQAGHHAPETPANSWPEAISHEEISQESSKPAEEMSYVERITAEQQHQDVYYGHDVASNVSFKAVKLAIPEPTETSWVNRCITEHNQKVLGQTQQQDEQQSQQKQHEQEKETEFFGAELPTNYSSEEVHLSLQQSTPQSSVEREIFEQRQQEQQVYYSAELPPDFSFEKAKENSNEYMRVIQERSERIQRSESSSSHQQQESSEQQSFIVEKEQRQDEQQVSYEAELPPTFVFEQAKVASEQYIQKMTQERIEHSSSYQQHESSHQESSQQRSVIAEEQQNQEEKQVYYSADLPPYFSFEDAKALSNQWIQNHIRETTKRSASYQQQESSEQRSVIEQKHQQPTVFFGPELPAQYSWEEAKVYTENVSYIERLTALQRREEQQQVSYESISSTENVSKSTEQVTQIERSGSVSKKQQQQKEPEVFYGPELPPDYSVHEKLWFREDLEYGPELPPKYNWDDVKHRGYQPPRQLSAVELAVEQQRQREESFAALKGKDVESAGFASNKAVMPSFFTAIEEAESHIQSVPLATPGSGPETPFGPELDEDFTWPEGEYDAPASAEPTYLQRLLAEQAEQKQHEQQQQNEESEEEETFYDAPKPTTGMTYLQRLLAEQGKGEVQQQYQQEQIVQYGPENPPNFSWEAAKLQAFDLTQKIPSIESPVSKSQNVPYASELPPVLEDEFRSPKSQTPATQSPRNQSPAPATAATSSRPSSSRQTEQQKPIKAEPKKTSYMDATKASSARSGTDTPPRRKSSSPPQQFTPSPPSGRNSDEIVRSPDAITHAAEIDRELQLVQKRKIAKTVVDQYHRDVGQSTKAQAVQAAQQQIPTIPEEPEPVSDKEASPSPEQPEGFNWEEVRNSRTETGASESYYEIATAVDQQLALERAVSEEAEKKGKEVEEVKEDKEEKGKKEKKERRSFAAPFAGMRRQSSSASMFGAKSAISSIDIQPAIAETTGLTSESPTSSHFERPKSSHSSAAEDLLQAQVQQGYQSGDDRSETTKRDSQSETNVVISPEIEKVDDRKKAESMQKLQQFASRGAQKRPVTPGNDSSTDKTADVQKSPESARSSRWSGLRSLWGRSKTPEADSNSEDKSIEEKEPSKWGETIAKAKARQHSEVKEAVSNMAALRRAQSASALMSKFHPD